MQYTNEYLVFCNLYVRYFECLPSIGKLSTFHSTLYTLADDCLMFRTPISKDCIKNVMDIVDKRYPDCFKIKIDTDKFNTINEVTITPINKYNSGHILGLMRINNDVRIMNEY